MRVLAVGKLIALAAVIIIMCTASLGASAPVEDEPGELIEAARQLFDAKLSELEREHLQRLHDAAKQLRDRAGVKAEQAQGQLARALLRTQLELVFVTLDQEQQQAKLRKINELQDQLVVLQNQAEQDYQADLVRLQAEQERLASLEIRDLQRQVEQALAEEFSAGLIPRRIALDR